LDDATGPGAAAVLCSSMCLSYFVGIIAVANCQGSASSPKFTAAGLLKNGYPGWHRIPPPLARICNPCFLLQGHRLQICASVGTFRRNPGRISAE